MNDIVRNLELIPIESVPLSESGVGRNINDRFSNIDRNFQSIIDSEYLKGQTGDGIYTQECLFDKDSTDELGIYKGEQSLTSGELYELISGCILTDVEYQTPLTDGRIPGGRIVLIYQNDNGEKKLISSLPYVFIDEVYLGNLREENRPNPNEDLSCIIYFENNEFVKSSTIPKIYYDENSATFCWNINGVPTQLPAQGPKGNTGESGGSIYYARCEYNKPSNENVKYIITEIYDARNNTYTDVFLITNGSIIVSEVTNATDYDNIPSVIIGVYNGEDNVKYIDQSVGLNIPDISTLMKGNPNKALYVDAECVSGESSNQKLYHSIYSNKENGTISLKMGLVDEDDQLISNDSNNQLISEYSNNIFKHNIEVKEDLSVNGGLSIEGELSLSDSNKPSINNGQNDQNKITITVGGQTSNEFTVPFATNATYIGSEENIKGKRNQPVYISNGQPVAIDISEGSGVEARPLLVINDGNEIFKTHKDKISVTYDTGTLTAKNFIGNFGGQPFNYFASNNSVQTCKNNLSILAISAMTPLFQNGSKTILFDEIRGDVVNILFQNWEQEESYKDYTDVKFTLINKTENIDSQYPCQIFHYGINIPYKDVTSLTKYNYQFYFGKNPNSDLINISDEIQWPEGLSLKEYLMNIDYTTNTKILNPRVEIILTCYARKGENSSWDDYDKIQYIFVCNYSLYSQKNPEH